MAEERGRTERGRALLISPEAPYPLDGGGALRTASLLHYLAARYDVDLIAFQHPGQRIAEALPHGLVRDVSCVELRHHENTLTARAVRNGMRVVKGRPPLVDRFSGYDSEIADIIGDRQYEIAMLEHFWSASYLPLVKRCAHRVVLDLHNVESAWHAGCARASSLGRSLMHRAFAKSALRVEEQWLGLCDHALTASEDDAMRVRRIAPGVPVSVYPNAIPWRAVLDIRPSFAIAFSGNMEYEPNLLGVRWFLQDVWPALKSSFPQLRFQIIGKNSHAIEPHVRDFPDVKCTGRVEDPLAHLAGAQVVIAPLRSGSGTRLKIIEAWAAERAVVSTTIGAEGLGAVHGRSILLADTAEGFAESVGMLLHDERLRQKIARAGREMFEKEFTWEQAWKRLDVVLGGSQDDTERALERVRLY